MEQQWTPIILSKPTSSKPTRTKTIPKTHINAQPSAFKTIKIYDPNDANAEPEIKPVMIDITFGRQMAKARQAKNITQKQLALATNIPASVINDYEKGKGVRNGVYVNKIKTYLGLHR